jgi:hypothetical protein
LNEDNAEDIYDGLGAKRECLKVAQMPEHGKVFYHSFMLKNLFVLIGFKNIQKILVKRHSLFN